LWGQVISRLLFQINDSRSEVIYWLYSG